MQQTNYDGLCHHSSHLALDVDEKILCFSDGCLDFSYWTIAGWMRIKRPWIHSTDMLWSQQTSLRRPVCRFCSIYIIPTILFLSEAIWVIRPSSLLQLPLSGDICVNTPPTPTSLAANRPVRTVTSQGRAMWRHWTSEPLSANECDLPVMSVRWHAWFTHLHDDYDIISVRGQGGVTLMNTNKKQEVLHVVLEIV